MDDEKAFTIEFADVELAEATVMAGELGKMLLDTSPDVSVTRHRADPTTQDPGSILAIVLAAPAVIAVAKGIADYLRLRRKAKIIIKCADTHVMLENVAGADASEIARQIMEKCSALKPKGKRFGNGEGTTAVTDAAGETDAMEPKEVSPDRTIVVLSGASRWPDTDLSGNDAYLKSCNGFKSYLLNDFRLPQRNLLNLFDANDTSQQMLSAMMKFIAQAKAGDRVTDLIFYHVGHGVISDDTREFYLPIRATQRGIDSATSLAIQSLASMLREQGRFLRRFLILDCCFSAAAWQSFQSSSPGKVAAEVAMQELPTRGVTLLCSSGPRNPSRVPEGSLLTMFSAALLECLQKGRPAGPTRLSFADMKSLAESFIQEKWRDQAVRPEIHSPVASDGDVRDVPFFPNAAMAPRGGSFGWPARPLAEHRVWDAASAIYQALARTSATMEKAEPSFSARLRADARNPLHVELSIVCSHREDMLRIYNRLVHMINGEVDELLAGAKCELTATSVDGMTPVLAGIIRESGVRGAANVGPPSPTISGTIGLVVRLAPVGADEKTPLEIRVHIRTMLDDLLVELERETRLAARDGRTARPMPQVERHFGVLRQLLASCAGFVEVIRTDLSEAAGELEEGRSSRSMLTPEGTERVLTRARVPKRLITEMMEILREREQIEKPPVGGAEIKLLGIAEKLKEINERESKPEGFLASSVPGRPTYLYTIRMEEALARVGTGHRDQLSRAATIYEELAVPFSHDAAVRYRLGWVLGKLSNPRMALANYLECEQLIAKARTLTSGRSAVDQDEFAFMSNRLRRLIGFQYWKVSQEHQRAGDTQEQVRAILSAYRETHPGLTVADPMEVLSAHNNMLYYVVEYLKLTPYMATGAAVLTKGDLELHLKYVEEHVDVATQNDDDLLDTLCFAYEYLGEGAKAVAAATRVLELLIGDGQGDGSGARAVALDDTKTDTLRRAYGIIRKYGSI